MCVFENEVMNETMRRKIKRSSYDYFSQDYILLLIPLFLGGLAYTFVHVNYNIYYVDDAWVISNIWNITQLGLAEDLVFIEPDEGGYVQYFGVTYAFLMGHLLNLLGWTKSNVFLVNSIFVWSTALVWYQILKQLPFSNIVAKLTVTFLPIFPPFFFAAHCGRPEAFAIFIISIQLLAFIKKRYFLAAILTGFAFESHIMGTVGLFFLLSFVIFKKEELILNKRAFERLFLQFTLGGLMAMGYYFSIHGNHFSWAELTGLISEKKDMGSPLNNYILNYFMNYDWYSRVWEFALFLGALGLYFRKNLFKGNRFLTILVLVLLISTLITRRENRNYLVYIFPAFILLYFYTFEQLKILKKFAVVLAFSMSLYYGLHFYFNGAYNFEKIVLETKRELKDKKLPIVGIPDFWFAAMDKKFIPIHHGKNSNLHALNKFYLIQSDYLEWRCKIYSHTINYYKQNYNAILVKEIPVFENQKIQIWECERNDYLLSKVLKDDSPIWKKKTIKTN